MTDPKQKAQEIKERFCDHDFINESEVRWATNVVVDLIIDEWSKEPHSKSKIYYWLKVKNEI